MSDTLTDGTTANLSKQRQVLANALDVIIANGAASFDTIRNYRNQMIHFWKWCGYTGCNPLQAREFNIEQYRHYLKNKNYKTRTIALKLTVVKRLYDAAIKMGLMAENPAINVKAPLEREQTGSNNNYLSEKEAQKLISCLPDDRSLAVRRDRLLVSLMVICGVRQIELHRLTLGDIIRRDDGKVGLKLFAKRNKRIIPLPPEVSDLLDLYLQARKIATRERVDLKKTEDKVNKKSPVFISLASNYYGQPLSRRAMQRIANHYLELAKLKICENRTVTTHGLRHTVGYLMTLAGNSLRVIQDYLGHADPKTTAIYAHIADLWHNNPATTINLRLRAT